MKTTQSKDGTTLAYDVFGKGPALIFITGATCFRSFEPVVHDAKVFAEQFTVYNYDRRGRGDSGNTLPYTIERELEDIEAMIDAAGGTAYVYGHSSGAILGLEAAMRLGGKVRKLVMYDPAYANDDANQKEFKELSQGLYKLLYSGKNDEAISIFLEGIGIPKEVITGMRQSPQWETMVALAPTLAYDTTLAMDLPPIARASQLTTPAQIIVGEESPSSIHEVAYQLSEGIPNSDFSMLEGQDHMPNPEVVLTIFSKFLKQ
ncbi:pimeloyl-ACP methyl ester carboxylesterase [Bacillus pakistanensis]|uniref:Pimeloyl-ACP methyl ester carboxylesterase n=1 Tax=Rossellomorea pakistanensis TaxID=992288 RepID=A0ABS2N6X2_9BACI|nr:alpha/beta hydrolase [Bacillus pakistanensis]MBM7583598.1 pimeloyl-ACP methyl ester carboxylesterase [Bacillus pakistanensis]